MNYKHISALLLAGMIFVLDSYMHRGIATGSLYCLPVLVSFMMPTIKESFIFTIIAIILAVAGYFTSPTSIDINVIDTIIDRCISIILILLCGLAVIYKKATKNIIEQQNIYQKALINTSVDPIISLDENGYIIDTNNAITKLIKWTPSDLIGKSFLDIVSSSDNRMENYFALPEEDRDLLLQGEYSIISKDMQHYPCEININKITSSALNKVYYSAVIKNTLHFKKAEERLIWLSTHDELTGIYNRRFFNHKLGKEWRRLTIEQSHLGILFIDIDYFKEYNDSLGHQQGDNCLHQIGFILNKCLHRSGEFVSRYGGEEFVILLPNADLQVTEKIAEHIHHELQTLKIDHPTSKISEYVTCSIGATSMIPSKACTSEILLRRADYALYQAKEEGRNRTVIFKE